MMSSNKDFHIRSLDGVRGLAALTVFGSHALARDLVPGGFGVTVFFFLSGYLITTLLRIEHEQTGRISLSRFYLRRIYRIIPPMYIVLIVSTVLALIGVFPHHMSVAAVLAQFAHLTNYYFIAFGQQQFAPATSVMWSLAVEEHFYLLFPLAISLVFHRFSNARTAAVLGVACCVILAWRCYLVLVADVGHAYTYYATDTRLDSLLYGCMMGVWFNPVMDQARLPSGRKVWITLLSVSTVLLLLSFLYRSPVFRETLRYSVQGIALFGLFFCAVRYSHWPLFSWLESRPMRAMGLISYTFYLVHQPCLLLLDLHLDMSKPVRAALGFTTAVAVSSAMYLLIERHLGTLRRRLHGGPGRPPVRGVAAKMAGTVSTR